MMSTIFSQFHFIRPWFLLLLPIIWGILVFLQKQRQQKDAWQEVCDTAVLALMQKTAQAQIYAANASAIRQFWRNPKWRLLLYPLTALMILALAGPSFRQENVPVTRNEPPLIIALESSHTMLAEDVKPSRLQRAKFVISDLLEQKKEGQFALISYTDSAYAVTPLTDDKATIYNLLAAVNPNIMPAEGNNTLAALEKAENLLTQSGFSSGDILLVADKIDNAQVSAKIERLAANNIRTSVLALGSLEGAPIKQEEGFMKDRNGQIVFSKVDTQNLANIAKLGAGKFASINDKASDTQGLLNYLSATQASKDQAQAQEKGTQIPETLAYVDDGYYLLWAILPILLLCFRRSFLLVMMMGLFFIAPMNIQPAYAANPAEQNANKASVNTDNNEHTNNKAASNSADAADSIKDMPTKNKWLNADQQVYRFLEHPNAENKPDIAPEQLKDTELKAAYLYQQQQFAEAAQDYKNQLETQASAKNYYNYANALAQTGDLAAALKAYEQGINLAQNDAKLLDNLNYNKKIVEDALKKQEEEKKKKEDQKKEDKQDDDQKKDQNQDQKGDQEDKSQQDQKQDQDQKQQDQQQQNKQNQQDSQKSDQQNSDQSEQEKLDQEKQAQEQKNKQAQEDDQKDEPKDEPTKEAQSEEDKKAQQEKEQQAQALKEAQDQTQDGEPLDEKMLIKQRVLEQVDSDPGVLLRNKFRREYQYQRGRK